jgi:dTDP-4-amino-4,6-dideoxygalactose transaminase
VIRVTGKGKRDALRERLSAEGIQTEVYYPRAMHEQDSFSSQRMDFLIAGMLAQETLALPISLTL